MATNKEAAQFKKGLVGLQEELVSKRNRLKSQTVKLRRIAAEQQLTPWAAEVMKLYSQTDYTYWKLLKLLRKHKVL